MLNFKIEFQLFLFYQRLYRHVQMILDLLELNKEWEFIDVLSTNFSYKMSFSSKDIFIDY